MSKWKDVYQKKLTTPQDAVKNLKSGDRVVLPLGVGEPAALLEAMVERKDELDSVMIDQMLAIRPSKYLQPGMEQHFRHNAWFISGASRSAVHEKRADFTPNYFHESPKLYEDYITVDVLMVTLSPMDKHGYFSFGTSVDYTSSVAKKAKLVIAEVNRFMPRTLGNSFIHINDVDVIVENDTPLPELPVPPINEIDEQIGSYIAEQIEDESTLQIGIGSIPGAVARYLTGKRDLGIHSEMLSDVMIDLIEQGVVTNRCKSLHRGKVIGSFAAGTRRLYEFLDDNPLIEMYPVSYTNDPYIIGKNNKMVAINSAIEVDLLGQCAAETIGYLQFSGTGGQTDFVRGAARSPGGKSFIAIYSTAKQGTVSKVVPTLKPGTVVSTSKNDVHYVVTEYGVAMLKGKTARERALALINIAHPNFREELRFEAEKLGLI